MFLKVRTPLGGRFRFSFLQIQTKKGVHHFERPPFPPSVSYHVLPGTTGMILRSERGKSTLLSIESACAPFFLSPNDGYGVTIGSILGGSGIGERFQGLVPKESVRILELSVDLKETSPVAFLRTSSEESTRWCALRGRRAWTFLRLSRGFLCCQTQGSEQKTWKMFVWTSLLARSPSSALLPFSGGGFPYENRQQKKGTLILNL